MSSRLFHSVIIASRGRSGILTETLKSIWKQQLPPDEVIVSVVSEMDIPPSTDNAGVRVIFGGSGLCIQRNSGMLALDSKSELVSFLDDDLELAPDYFAQIRSFFSENPLAIGANGNILLDGCSRQAAEEILQKKSTIQQDGALSALKSLYGCNMHFRRQAIGEEKFDERLSLYGWLEDYDFSTRVGRKGGLYWIPQAKLCHLKEASGRMNNRKFGFAQIMNPYYLYKKQLLNFSEFMKCHVLPCTASNLYKILADRDVGGLASLVI
jgi:GT2 family glycosyltransferase